MRLIVATDSNGLIGNGDKLPWRIPEDLEFFKRKTMGSAVLMGRKTFESIGRLLPGRENIVLTRDEDYAFEGLRVAHDLSSFEDFDGFLIGGAELYRECIARGYVTELWITTILKTYEGDVYFPYKRSELMELGYEEDKFNWITVAKTGETLITSRYYKNREGSEGTDVDRSILSDDSK